MPKKKTSSPKGKAVGAHPFVLPKTPVEWAGYRCRLSCEIGRNVIARETLPPDGVTPLEYAIFNLFHAIEELSRQNVNALAPAGGKSPTTPQDV